MQTQCRVSRKHVQKMSSGFCRYTASFRPRDGRKAEAGRDVAVDEAHSAKEGPDHQSARGQAGRRARVESVDTRNQKSSVLKSPES